MGAKSQRSRTAYRVVGISMGAAVVVWAKVAGLLLPGAAASEALDAFHAPWEDGERALVIDAYEQNEIDWDLLATDTRVVAVIHKATQGLKPDPLYAARREEALRRGYLWGAYHLGTDDDPVAQADHYLEVARPEDSELLALDLESLDPGHMSVDDARRFILRIVEATGRYPLLYANHDITRRLSEQVGRDEVFSRCPLWYARFRKDIPDFPEGTWTVYTLWQFSSEVNCESPGACLYNVPGTRFDIDVNVYLGTPDELRAHWPLGTIAARMHEE